MLSVPHCLLNSFLQRNPTTLKHESLLCWRYGSWNQKSLVLNKDWQIAFFFFFLYIPIPVSIVLFVPLPEMFYMPGRYLYTDMWARAWRKGSSLRSKRTWPPWRRIMKKWAQSIWIAKMRVRSSRGFCHLQCLVFFPSFLFLIPFFLNPLQIQSRLHVKIKQPIKL